MIQTPGTYYQGTDLILRHYVQYTKQFIEVKNNEFKTKLDKDLTCTERGSCTRSLQNEERVFLWKAGSLPALGFIVLVDALPGVMEIIGGLDMDFYMIVVNYGSVHWRLGFVRDKMDVEKDSNASFHCIVDNHLVRNFMQESERIRRTK